MRIHFLASERHFIDHLAPVWHALDAHDRGEFCAPRTLLEHAASRGIAAVASIDHPRAVLVASYGDQKRARLLPGRPTIARVEHGVGQSYTGLYAGNYAGGRDCDDVGLLLCPNEYSANRWRAAYPRARVEVVGSPKLDATPRDPVERPTAGISFHWDCNLVPETRSAFAHFKPALRAIAALQPEVNIIGHAHPRAFDALAPHYRRAGIEPVAEFSEVLQRTDVYACDNSSTLFEFASTGRPVVVLNAPWYRRNVDHGGRFWDWADIGIQVDGPAGLVDALFEAVADAPDRRRRRAEVVDEVYAVRVGAAQRAAAALVDWASSDAERKAA